MPVTLATETRPQRVKTIDELRPVLMSMKEVVVLDIETTGFSPDKFSEIIEIGAVKLDIEKNYRRRFPAAHPPLKHVQYPEGNPGVDQDYCGGKDICPAVPKTEPMDAVIGVTRAGILGMPRKKLMVLFDRNTRR